MSRVVAAASHPHADRPEQPCPLRLLARRLLVSPCPSISSSSRAVPRRVHAYKADSGLLCCLRSGDALRRCAAPPTAVLWGPPGFIPALALLRPAPRFTSHTGSALLTAAECSAAVLRSEPGSARVWSKPAACSYSSASEQNKTKPEGGLDFKILVAHLHPQRHPRNGVSDYLPQPQPYLQLPHQLERDPETGEWPTAMQVWRATYQKADGTWSIPTGEEIMTKLHEVAGTQQEKISSAPVPIVEHFALVLGRKPNHSLWCWHSCCKPSRRGKNQIAGTN